MIHALVIEDEMPIRNGILNHIDWKGLGIQEVKGAGSGEEALSICRGYRADVVISDIRMPGMDGTELCRRLLEILPQCQIIFISGYSDKEYYRAAIHLHAVDFVEKPIDTAVLSAAISRAVEEISRRHQSGNSGLHRFLMNQEINPTREGFLEYFRCKNSIREIYYGIAVVRTRPGTVSFADLETVLEENLQKSMEGEVHVLSDWMNRSTFVLLILSEEPVDRPCEKHTGQLILEKSDGDCFAVISGCFSGEQNLRPMVTRCMKAAGALSYCGWNRFVWAEEEPREYTEPASDAELTKLYHLIATKDFGSAQKMIRDRAQSMIDAKAALGYTVRNWFFQMDYVITRADENMHLHASKETPENSPLESLETIEELCSCVLSHLSGIMQQEGEDHEGGRVIREICSYIDENLQDSGISLEKIAGRVYLTPTYLSAMFRKKTGKTIGQYITDARISRAKELLRDPKYRLYDIAEMVGYTDSKYFARMFKKQTGLTPSEYRESVIK